ncbi:virion structural protein [Pseudomonas phage Noxifer]|uniref:Virion structural protein n=1 Tax=Pseudomonas phage Noxifer TaxID=2006684 RepID=A0A1Y0SUW9_9CAUD|nr:virion structural protein [Pseudomonas phage Noxifer]ARV77190.1 virion structural protein [Pseudomonas phage Noxifer]
MNEYLLRHAISTVWCNPSMDRQHVYKLVPVSPRFGVHTSYTVDYMRYQMPTERDYYMIYQIGKVEPKLLGLPKRYAKWMSLAEIANETALYSELYLNNGIQFPRHEVYVLLTGGKNLIIAVKMNERVGSLDKQDVYMRFYNNSYFDSVRSTQAARKTVFVMGGTPKTSQELVNLQIGMATELTARPGRVPYYFVNGRFSNTLSLMNCTPGDAMEMVIDSSIDRYIDFPISALPTFQSTLDNENKFMLHYNDPTEKSIRFYDDLDVFIIKEGGGNGRFLGATYHRNEGNWIRQLTHKDYSVPIERLNAFKDAHPTDPRFILDSVKFTEDKWNSLSELKLRVYFRQSGYDRPLQPEASRIHELYRMSDTRVVRAMTGVDSTLDIWKAANLEKAAYPKFMGAPTSMVVPIGFNDPDVTSEAKEAAQEFAGQVFGYHAAASLLAATPTDVKNVNGRREALLNYAYWYNATVFEFDAAGVLLEWHPHAAGRRYPVRNAATVRVEAIVGKGGNSLNTVYDRAPVPLDLQYNFRVYVVEIYAGVQRGGWRDITDLPNRADWGYLDTSGATPRWVWTYDQTKWYGCVRQDNAFLCYPLTISKAMGTLRFSVASYETHQGLTDYKLLEVPFAQLDLFMNGRALIEGLDYTVKWPEVVVHNIEYLDPGAAQLFLVRGHGMCEGDLSRPVQTEFGFIEYGLLSNDTTYNIHTHKVQRMVIDGHYRDPKSLHFEEDWGTAVVTDERNGAPYCIQTPPMVFRDVYEYDRVARDEDNARDTAVATYMGNLYPKRPRGPIDTITHQYAVVSCFANKLVHDLVSGLLAPAGLLDRYNDDDIRKWLKSYEWLLDYDLANTSYNETHVQVYPHWIGAPVGLPIERYNFLKRALKTYLRTPPDISAFVFVDNGI